MSMSYTQIATRPDGREDFPRPQDISCLPLVWPVPAEDSALTLVLRNSGGKPLRLQAQLLAEGSSRGATSNFWHETAIYRTQDSKFAVALRFLSADTSGAGLHRARLFKSEDEAATWLEIFDPTGDLDADFDVSDSGSSMARIVLKAAALRERAECLERAYRIMVGELLFRLETER